MTTFLSGALFLLSLCSGFLAGNALAPHNPAPQALGATLPQAVAVFETSLASPITTSATTMTLTANAIRGGGALSGYNCFTVDEGSAQAETICGTVSATTVSSLSRGISQSIGTTTVAALQFSHRRGANVKITDFPIIQILKAQANGEDTYPNLIYYANGTVCNAASPSTAICGKGYSDALIAQGAATSTETITGISRLATQLQAASSTDLGANTPLVLQAKYATSSPGTAGLWAVITNNAGKIAQPFLDLTQAFSFSGAITATASTTFGAATSTFTGPVNFGNGAVNFQNSPSGLDWGLIFSTTTTSGVLAINATTTAYNRYKVVFEAAGMSAASSNPVFRFNNDIGSTYGYQTITNTVSVATSGGTSGIAFGTATTSAQTYTFEIENDNATNRKFLTWNGAVYDSGTSVPVYTRGAAVWNNTSNQITTFNFQINGVLTFNSGSALYIYGAR